MSFRPIFYDGCHRGLLRKSHKKAQGWDVVFWGGLELWEVLTVVFRVEGLGFGDTTHFPRPKSGANEALQP